MIARRKRMLQTFLNRIARHPILSNEHVFHRFLDGEVSWVRMPLFGKGSAPIDLLLLKTEVLHSPPISLLPKNILKAPAHNPTDPNASPAYEALPNPSPAHPLRRPDQRFLDSEVFTNKFASHLSGPMEKVTRRTMRRWSGWFLTLFTMPPLVSILTICSATPPSDYAQDHMELGAIWNGFSLNESGELATAIEKTGQAVDATYVNTTRLVP